MKDLSLDLPIDDSIQMAPESPLAQSIDLGGGLGQGPGFKVGNRYCIHPMEGWDATTDGHPTPDLIRRWRRFGESGAKFMWGMEAGAVRPDGRANPNQLMAKPDTIDELRKAADECLDAHTKSFGTASDLLWGFQLTHSGRFSAGVAVAPVTDWHDYDSIYTERYMGLPQENAEGYKNSSPVHAAANLQGRLLIVHGTSDDNVHMQNTLQMVQALIAAGKQFDLMEANTLQ